MTLAMLGVAASAAPAKADSVEPEVTDAASTAANRRLVVEVTQALAARDQPGDAFTAALMTRSAAEGARATRTPAPPSQAGLLERAEVVSPRDPLVAWAKLMLICPPRRKGCDPRSGIQELIDRDPHNAFPWVLALADAQQRKDAAGAARALSNAAAAEVYDDYMWAIDHRVLSALANLPSLPIERDPVASVVLNSEDGLDAEGRRTALGLGVMLAIAVPAYGTVSETCRPRSDGSDDPITVADCKALASRMMGPSGTLIDWQVGLAVALRLTTNPAERDALDATKRRIRYLVDTGADLVMAIERDPAELRAYAERRRRASGSEIDFTRSELERVGLPAEPPAGWWSREVRPFTPKPPAGAAPTGGRAH